MAPHHEADLGRQANGRRRPAPTGPIEPIGLIDLIRSSGPLALGMMLPGLAAGWLQERPGYSAFFVWCCVATLPSFAAVAWVRLPGDPPR